MLFQNILAIVPLLALAAASPISPDVVATDVPTILPGQGAKTPIGPPALEASTLEARALSGPGTSVSGEGLNWYQPSLNVGGNGYSDKRNYVCYRGNKDKFPSFDKWMNFATMWNLQKPVMLTRDSGAEVGIIYDTILQVSREAKVDPRLILAVIMQESGGNLRVICSNNGIHNCGIMQAYTGSVSYNPSDRKASILHMIRDGTQGTSQGPGFVQWISQNSQTAYTGPTHGNPYQAARGYNSGDIHFNNLSDGIKGTAAYVSDIANRLLGWGGDNCNNPKWRACGFPGC